MRTYVQIPWLCRSLMSGLCCLAFGISSAQANPKVYERALASTGWIIVPREKNSATGTCWLADRERKWLITSMHLTDDAKEVLIYFPQQADGELAVDWDFYLLQVAAIHGRVIATDTQRALA